MKETTVNQAIGRFRQVPLETPSLSKKMQQVLKKLNLSNVEICPPQILEVPKGLPQKSEKKSAVARPLREGVRDSAKA
jgi:hypothetical protein